MGDHQNQNYISPIYVYQHGIDGDAGEGCGITGGYFFNPAATNYPAELVGRYFFLDYCNRWINMLDLNGTVTRLPFATGIPNFSLGIDVGTDGNLYFLSREDNALYKVVYNAP